jgi:hypothetical protein
MKRGFKEHMGYRTWRGPVVLALSVLVITARGGDGPAKFEVAARQKLVPLLAVTARPEAYYDRTLSVHGFVKRYSWGIVCFHGEDAARYDLLEYGMVVDLEHCANASAFAPITDGGAPSVCHKFEGALDRKAFERRYAGGVVQMPVFRVTKYAGSREAKPSKQ